MATCIQYVLDSLNFMARLFLTFLQKPYSFVRVSTCIGFSRKEAYQNFALKLQCYRGFVSILLSPSALFSSLLLDLVVWNASFIVWHILIHGSNGLWMFASNFCWEEWIEVKWSAWSPCQILDIAGSSNTVDSRYKCPSYKWSCLTSKNYFDLVLRWCKTSLI